MKLSQNYKFYFFVFLQVCIVVGVATQFLP